jgi:phosphotransferase system HPr (HPr) family protein
MMSDKEGAPERSLEEIIREDEFQPLLEARSRPFFELLNLLRARPDLELNKKLLWKIREETHALETFLDDFGARNNKVFSYFTEVVSSVRNFAQALFELHHVARRYRRYRLLDDDARAERILAECEETERCCRRHMLALMVDGERDARAFLRFDLPTAAMDDRLFRDPVPTMSLPQNVDEGEIVDESAKVGEIATKFIRAVENWKSFRFKPLSEPAALRRFVLTRYNEELARKAEGIVHNLQAKYDTYIKGTMIETGSGELPVLRGHISMALHLFGCAQHLVHFYERHENDIRFELTKEAIASVVSKHQVLDRIVNFAVANAGDYLERAEPVARELVKQYVRECERTLPLRDGISLHARPATLIVRIVNHYGTPVQMVMDGKSTDARSITGILLLSGTNVDVREVTFRGDEMPLRDLELLFESDMGGDDLSGLPEELAYLRD